MHQNISKRTKIDIFVSAMIVAPADSKHCSFGRMKLDILDSAQVIKVNLSALGKTRRD